MKTKQLLITAILISFILVPDLQGQTSKDRSSWLPNPSPSKYFIGPSAIPLEKSTGYYQNSYILFNQVAYGFTNWFSMSVGLEFVSTFATLANPPFRPIVTANPKFGFKVADKLYLSVSGFYLNATIANDEETPEMEGTFGLLFGQVTYGSPENNLTAGVAWGYSWNGLADRPLISLSGMYRVARRMTLMTENYVVPFGEGKYRIESIYGLRFLGEKICFDLGFINDKDLAGILLIGIPYIGFTFGF